ncbi:MAG: hypothetical protein UT69_C0030G0005 [Candidatus Yanofskybacteria bacterium GW2011_GWE1_40_10]|nr:MAG: hypothetical protein UT69_C0030G0005 [Candidatus Yanofskybacteria bacterium GW2011_GWE1_40_10]
MPTRTVTGTAFKPDGSVWASVRNHTARKHAAGWQGCDGDSRRGGDVELSSFISENINRLTAGRGFIRSKNNGYKTFGHS